MQGESQCRAMALRHGILPLSVRYPPYAYRWDRVWCDCLGYNGRMRNLSSSEPRRTRIKICGVTRAYDARMAVELGADLIGLNLVAGSRKIAL